MQAIPGAVIRDLCDGLVLRWARRSDAEPVGAFNAEIFKSPEGVPSEWARNWTVTMIGGPHPTMQEGCATIVEDTKTRRIVSSMCLIPQTWSCEGVTFGVGRPELVGTDPAYRRRGLVSAQFDVFHKWSAALGHLMQAITGIPWYYRQFGYEMTMDLGANRYTCPHLVPQLKEGATEPVAIRPATPTDIPFLCQCYDQSRERYVYTCSRDHALWQHEMSEGMQRCGVKIKIIEIERAPIGYFVHGRLRRGMVSAWQYWLMPGNSYWDVTPAVLRHIKQYGDEELVKDPAAKFEQIVFELGSCHPAIETCSHLLPVMREPYAWYIRVPDIPAYLRRISSVIEARLAQSPMTGYSGKLVIHAYCWAFQVRFEKGRLAGAESCKVEDKGDVYGEFPGLTFLHLVMGHRTIAELRHVYPDCGASDEGRALLAILFPKKPSAVWPVS